jgi:hypothetical protein
LFFKDYLFLEDVAREHFAAARALSSSDKRLRIESKVTFLIQTLQSIVFCNDSYLIGARLSKPLQALRDAILAHGVASWQAMEPGMSRREQQCHQISSQG